MAGIVLRSHAEGLKATNEKGKCSKIKSDKILQEYNCSSKSSQNDTNDSSRRSSIKVRNKVVNIKPELVATSLICRLPLSKIKGILDKNTFCPSIASLRKKFDDKLPESLEIPLNEKIKTQILCLYCNKKFYKRSIESHVKKIHIMPKLRRCSSRNAPEKTLKTQINCSEDAVTSPCIFCKHEQTSIKNLCDLFFHMIDCHSDKYFGCKICFIRFRSRASLSKHIETVHNSNFNLSYKSITNTVTSNQPMSKLIRYEKVEKQHKLETYTMEHNLINSDPILSRLGIAQNRLPANRKSLRLNQNAVQKTTPQKTELAVQHKKIRKRTSTVKSPTAIDNLELARATVKTDSFVAFASDFYEKVVSNVRVNLMHFIDGNVDKEIKLTKSHTRSLQKRQLPTLKINDFKVSNVIYTATKLSSPVAYPTILTAEQYGVEVNKTKTRGSITKHSWKWKWDSCKKFKFLKEGGKLVKFVKQQKNNLQDLSKLDMWTQLTMRRRIEFKNNISMTCDQSSALSPCDTEFKQRLREQLDDILDTRLLPRIILEQNKEATIKQEIEEINCKNTDSLNTLRDCDRMHEDFFFLLDLKQQNGTMQKSSLFLSGEWTRPRCYLCMDCGLKFDTRKALDEHKGIRHAHVFSTYYEIVGRDLMNMNLQRYLFIPKRALNRFETNLDACSSNQGTVSNVSENNCLDDASAKYQQQIPSPNSASCSKEIQNLNEKNSLSEKNTSSIACTKCFKKCNGSSELYRHMLDCSGDYLWNLAKKRKYRYYCGYKKRRQCKKSLLKHCKKSRQENLSKTDARKKNLKSNSRSFQQLKKQPRKRPSDAESIRKMIENLPLKRTAKHIIPKSDKKPKKSQLLTRVHTREKRVLTRNRRLQNNAICLKSNRAKKIKQSKEKKTQEPNLETKQNLSGIVVDKEIENDVSLAKATHESDSLATNPPVSVDHITSSTVDRPESKSNVTSENNKPCLTSTKTISKSVKSKSINDCIARLTDNLEKKLKTEKPKDIQGATKEIGIQETALKKNKKRKSCSRKIIKIDLESRTSLQENSQDDFVSYALQTTTEPTLQKFGIHLGTNVPMQQSVSSLFKNQQTEAKKASTTDNRLLTEFLAPEVYEKDVQLNKRNSFELSVSEKVCNSIPSDCTESLQPLDLSKKSEKSDREVSTQLQEKSAIDNCERKELYCNLDLLKIPTVRSTSFKNKSEKPTSEVKSTEEKDENFVKLLKNVSPIVSLNTIIEQKRNATKSKESVINHVDEVINSVVLAGNQSPDPILEEYGSENIQMSLEQTQKHNSKNELKNNEPLLENEKASANKNLSSAKASLGEMECENNNDRSIPFVCQDTQLVTKHIKKRPPTRNGMRNSGHIENLNQHADTAKTSSLEVHENQILANNSIIPKSIENPTTDVIVSTAVKNTSIEVIAKKPRRPRKNELAAIVADQLLESFKIDEEHKQNLKRLEGLVNEKSTDLLKSMLLINNTKRNTSSMSPKNNLNIKHRISSSNTELKIFNMTPKVTRSLSTHKNSVPQELEILPKDKWNYVESELNTFEPIHKKDVTSISTVKPVRSPLIRPSVLTFPALKPMETTSHPASSETPNSSRDPRLNKQMYNCGLNNTLPESAGIPKTLMDSFSHENYCSDKDDEDKFLSEIAKNVNEKLTTTNEDFLLDRDNFEMNSITIESTPLKFLRTRSLSVCNVPSILEDQTTLKDFAESEMVDTDMDDNMSVYTSVSQSVGGRFSRRRRRRRSSLFSNRKQKRKPVATDKVFCELCNKMFNAASSLAKHQTSIAHVTKLSEKEYMLSNCGIDEHNKIKSSLVFDNNNFGAIHGNKPNESVTVESKLCYSEPFKGNESLRLTRNAFECNNSQDIEGKISPDCSKNRERAGNLYQSAKCSNSISISSQKETSKSIKHFEPALKALSTPQVPVGLRSTISTAEELCKNSDANKNSDSKDKTGANQNTRFMEMSHCWSTDSYTEVPKINFGNSKSNNENNKPFSAFRNSVKHKMSKNLTDFSSRNQPTSTTKKFCIDPDRPFKGIGLEEIEAIKFEKPNTFQKLSSTSTYSDRDSFVFDSLDYDDEDEVSGETSIKGRREEKVNYNESESSAESNSTFVSKPLIMDRVFKNATGRIKCQTKSTDTCLKKSNVNETHFNDIFDELRQESFAQNKHANIKPTTRVDDIEKPKSAEKVSSNAEVNDGIQRLTRSNKCSHSKEPFSQVVLNNVCSETNPNKHVREQRKSNRLNSSHRQKKIVEMWSSDEYEELLSTKDIFALIEEKEKAEKRRKRNKGLKKPVETDNCLNPNEKQSVRLSVKSKKIGNISKSRGRHSQSSKLSSKATKESKKSSTFNSDDLKRIEKQKPSKRKHQSRLEKSDIETKPDSQKSWKNNGDLNYFKRSKTGLPKKVHYWSSSSQEDLRCNVGENGQSQEHYQKHGWIVGDSHKKLVTLLAIAKGSKKTEGSCIKKRKLNKISK